jgi:Fe-S-cluster formation regulator IscX/YfhJ
MCLEVYAMNDNESKNKLFLEHLRELARDGKLSAFANDVGSYISQNPTAKAYVIERLSGILLNNYVVSKVTVNFDELQQWTIDNPGWEDSIKTNAMSGEKLLSAVAALMGRINNECGT